MAENIMIETDGVEHNYSGVKEIHTHDAESGSTTWIPNLDTQLLTKHIYNNGTYKASSDGAYAYDKVIVATTGKATGKKQDGNTYVVQPDINGDLTETKVPTEIRITTNPTKMSYEDGTPIDLTGAVVKAYNGDGSLWTATGYADGIIPNSELNIVPPNAEYKGGEESSIYRKGDIVCLALNVNVAYSGNYSHGYINPSPIGEYDAGGIGHVWNFMTAYEPMTVYVTKYDDNGTIKYAYTTNVDDKPTAYISTAEDGTSGKGAGPFLSNVSGKNYIFESISEAVNETQINKIIDSIPLSTENPLNKDFSGATSESNKQDIQLNWDRPEDGQTLSDKFTIETVPLR